jgi:ABC-2 type transport system permease protein
VILDYITGIRFQAVVLRRSPATLITLLTTPFLTLAFAAILKQADKPDLLVYAVIGPSVMAVWGMALMVSGDIIATDRGTGVLEAVIATPAAIAAVIFGRITTVTLTSLLAVPESLLTAWLAFRVSTHVTHPAVLAATLGVTALAMAGTAAAFTAIFVLGRSARTFQNSLTYPFYVLSGAVVPVAVLPGWLHPIAHVVFLSWSSDLVRDCLRPVPIPNAWQRIAIVAVLGLVAYLAGHGAMQVVLRRLRATGSAVRA